uniref:Tc1-like transposase DDE domain-containing protein n=1 Tax=Arion vulgaris TaxID=1028688 RepID=A0A0B7BL94_9EUPU
MIFSETQHSIAPKPFILPHPPYSPDLAPCDFLFPQLKKQLKSCRFDVIEDIQTNETRQLFKKVPIRGAIVVYKNV